MTEAWRPSGRNEGPMRPEAHPRLTASGSSCNRKPAAAISTSPEPPSGESPAENQEEALVAQSVRDKVMVITGASSGIGRAAARLFAAEGARLALVARSDDKLKALAKEIGGEPLIAPIDLTRAGDVETTLRAIEQHFGRIDILFVNAGSYVAGEAAQGDPDEWDRVIALNVNAVFRCVHAVLPGVIARKSGDIVVTSSISGHQAIHWEPVYSATKHAI